VLHFGILFAIKGAVGKTRVIDIFKSSLIWLRTGERPLLQIDLQNKTRRDNFVFLFSDTAEVRAAIDEYVRNETGFRSFSELYKNLRQELYLRKGTINERGQDPE
jgi:hypothetical protein